jgi:putative dimethyl sulfoxide reductase chaperone
MSTPSDHKLAAPAALGPSADGSRTSRPKSVFGNYQAGEAASESPASSPPEGLGSIPLKELQALIDTAMARAFIYRCLAQAFEYPTCEGWQWLSNSETQETFSAAMEQAALRQTAFTGRSPLQLEAAAFVSHLNTGDLASFTTGYLAAFGHSARGDCPLNEIEYGDMKADGLFQPHRLADLSAFYRAFGLELSHDAAERHDHISIELEFLSVLAAKEAFALEHQLEREYEVCRQAEKDFLREHLGRWTPAFTRRLSKFAGHSPLGALARTTREFVLSECEWFGVRAGSEDLLLRSVDEAVEKLCDSCGIKDSIAAVKAEAESRNEPSGLPKIQPMIR